MTAPTPWYVDTYTTASGAVINNLRAADHRIIATCPDRATAMEMVRKTEHGPLWDDVQALRQSLADAVDHHNAVQAEQRTHYQAELDKTLKALRQMRERYEPC